mmetsp:Transcript_56259/g.155717  ORF Transcript_56259/g.155717 Transcript_56259/m.155717 type:complete len:209 (+) Transcript_56259:407-1033(+)
MKEDQMSAQSTKGMPWQRMWTTTDHPQANKLKLVGTAHAGTDLVSSGSSNQGLSSPSKCSNFAVRLQDTTRGRPRCALSSARKLERARPAFFEAMNSCSVVAARANSPQGAHSLPSSPNWPRTARARAGREAPPGHRGDLASRFTLAQCNTLSEIFARRQAGRSMTSRPSLGAQSPGANGGEASVSRIALKFMMSCMWRAQPDKVAMA